MNGNGEGPTGTRLDGIERALELLTDYHVQFREEHKHLLAAQVLLTRSLDRLTDRVDKNWGATGQTVGSRRQTNR
jgi:hypothetical protein